jgi:double-stranded uracil-DNA glycosylase
MFEEAERTGSLDSNIQRQCLVVNDFASFFKTHKEIELICFNGQSARGLFLRHVEPEMSESVSLLRRTVLPSTSPANAQMRFEEKLSRWQDVLGGFIT